MKFALRKMVSTLALGASCYMLPPIAHADLRATLGFEAGLDDETIRMIEAMPASVREETVRAVQESLILVDKSVFSYLNKVDEILSNRLLQMQCVVVGAGKATIEEIKASLNPFNRTGPQLVLDLQDRVDAFPSLLDKNSSLTTIKQAYSGIEDTARKTWCSVTGTLSAEAEVQKLRALLKARSMLWERIPDGTCSNARTCLVAVKNETDSLVAKADPRDAKLVGAAAKLSATKLPPEVFYRRFDPVPYEQELKTLYQVRDGIKVISAARDRLARIELSKAAQLLDTINYAIAQGNAIMASTNATELEAAKRDAVSRRVNLKLIEEPARQAGELVPSLKASADQIISQARERDSVLAGVTASLGDNAAAIRKRQELNDRISVFKNCGKQGCNPH